MKNLLLFTISSFIFVTNLHSINYATWNKVHLTLKNEVLTRVINLKTIEYDGFKSTSFILNSDSNNFISSLSSEFSVEINNVVFSGISRWKLIECKIASDIYQGNGATLVLKPLNSNVAGLQLSITYLLYPNLPLIKKSIEFLNESTSEVKIGSLDIESITTTFDLTHTWIYNNYSRNKTINGYHGNYYDPAIAVHSVVENRGIILGNEAPGVMKRTEVMTDGKTLSIGMNHEYENYPFRKYLKPGEKWTSPATFVGLYNNSFNPSEALNTLVTRYVRKHLGARIFQMHEIPTAIYNTWAPFRGDMTTATVIDVAKNAAECGFSHFVIDAGWNTIDGKPTITGNKDLDWILNLGDWLEDRGKFPNGLKEVFDNVQKLGMKSGLWISVATATKNAKIYRNHPDWFVKDENGNPAFLHDESGNLNQVTACLAGPYYDYIKNVIIKLVKEHGLAYVKLDLSMVTSAYRFNSRNTGCCATNHTYHKDREESYISLYERCFQLFDDIHTEAPDLFIDCTFETMGKLQLIDFAMLKHAEGNWLTNIDEPSPKGSWRVRQMAWWRSPIIPASSMIIGNMIINEPNFYLSLQSLSGSMPIMLGDTRKLLVNEKLRMIQWANWMKEMQAKHQIMLYRQDLQGFGEPTYGSWDGFQRINTETQSGGIVGVFRQGAAEAKRMVVVKYLNPNGLYEIVNAGSGEKILKLTGKEIENRGFAVQLNKEFDGELFEIKLVN